MRLYRLVLVVCSILGGLLGQARAVPELQLDILGGTYDDSSETILANSPIFTLRALLKGAANLPGPYYISAALLPAPAQPNSPIDAGSFSVAGVTYSTTSLSYGVPPLNVPDNMSGNLAKHGVYPTYYKEISFNFSAAHTIAAYNTESQTGSSGSLYYYDFTVNVSDLVPGYYLHFDLYDEKIKKGLFSIDDFAPFSHDAESRPNEGITVPDGGSTAILLGAALMGQWVWRCRRRRMAR